MGGAGFAKSQTHLFQISFVTDINERKVHDLYSIELSWRPFFFVKEMDETIIAVNND